MYKYVRVFTRGHGINIRTAVGIRKYKSQQEFPPAVCAGRVLSRGRDDVRAVGATLTAHHTILSI